MPVLALGSPAHALAHSNPSCTRSVDLAKGTCSLCKPPASLTALAPTPAAPSAAEPSDALPTSFAGCEDCYLSRPHPTHAPSPDVEALLDSIREVVEAEYEDFIDASRLSGDTLVEKDDLSHDVEDLLPFSPLALGVLSPSPRLVLRVASSYGVRDVEVFPLPLEWFYALYDATNSTDSEDPAYYAAELRSIWDSPRAMALVPLLRHHEIFRNEAPALRALSELPDDAYRIGGALLSATTASTALAVASSPGVAALSPAEKDCLAVLLAHETLADEFGLPLGRFPEIVSLARLLAVDPHA